jgi:hypothetical protein
LTKYGSRRKYGYDAKEDKKPKNKENRTPSEKNIANRSPIVQLTSSSRFNLEKTCGIIFYEFENSIELLEIPKSNWQLLVLYLLIFLNPYIGAFVSCATDCYCVIVIRSRLMIVATGVILAPQIS